MNKCGYCGRDNEDNATHCRECGTELITAHPLTKCEAAAEAEPITTASVDQKRTIGFSIEYWLLLAIAISASGYLYAVVAVVILYLVFKRMRPLGDWELLMVASGITGTRIFEFLHLLSLNASPLRFLEPAVVTGAAIALLFTQWRNVARFLVAYQAFGVAVEFLWTLLCAPKNIRPQDVAFSVIISGLGVWLLMRWLRRHRADRESVSSNYIGIFRKD
jgi:zinc-ribbon domain